MPELLPDTKLSHYRIVSKIGEGGMGEVYLAEDTRLERKVAIKFLSEEFSREEERLRRFTQEAKAVSALNHPNILTIHEIGEAEGKRFIASEFINGETLREKIAGQTLDLHKTLEIAIQIASALEAAHASRIVHRDIKPDNVMLREDSLVKVLDFGLAKLTEQQTPGTEEPTRPHIKTRAGTILGTPSYMSPEQTRGKSVDARSDIWSLGVVLYEMLTKRRPFEGETDGDIIATILRTEPVPPSRFNAVVPAELDRIIKKILKKKSDERYQTANDLLIDLKGLKHDLEFAAELERTASTNENDAAESRFANAATTDTPRRAATAASLSDRTGNRKTAIAAVIAVLLFAALTVGYWYFNSQTANQIDSIAVMPFVNDSGNADVEYLSDGMTETLIASLSQLPNLNVKARSSVFRYKGKGTDAQTIAKELNVQAILNGRVVQRGQDLILNVELVDAKTENVLWTENYSRQMVNLVSLQSDIARDLSQKLKTKLSGADVQKLAKTYTANPEAYQLYLQGRFHWNKRTPKDNAKSIEYLQQAIAIDPNYALAYAGLSDAYGLAFFEDMHQRMPRAREAALKALSLDNDLAEAHTALGHVLTRYDYDFAGAEREYRRAIELDSNYATAHQRYGELLTYLGRHEESLAEFRRALDLEPLSLVFNTHYGHALIYARRYDEAIAQLKKTLELDANFWQTHFIILIAYQVKGDHAESVEALAKTMELRGDSQATAAAALAQESFAKGGWEGYLRYCTVGRRPVIAYFLATCHAALGEKDKAFAELNKSFEERQPYVPGIKVDPLLDPLRDDPRFRELLKKVGFPE